MSTSIQPIRLNHMNVLLENAEATQQHFKSKFDAERVIDIPKAEYHACLLATSGVLFEIFTPRVYLFNARFGPHFLGVEYQANMDDVVAAVKERNMRIIRESRYEKDLAGNPGYALHTHPADGFGVSYEFYHDDFHQWHWPDLNGKITPKEAWLNHPSSIFGQYGYTHAVKELDAACEFLQSFLSAAPIYEEARPEIGAHAIGLKIADAIVELQTPTQNGALAEHLYHFGDGIRSTVFRVQDLQKTKQYFEALSTPLVAGYKDDCLMIAPENNLGVIFEFIQA